MKHAIVKASRCAFNVIYRIVSSKTRRDEVAFLSRQTNKPSFDFAEIAREFESRGWKTHMHLKKVSNRNLPSYALHVLKELRLLGTCKIAILDRYDPVVSLMDFECENAYQNDSHAASAPSNRVNRSFPVKPVILQVWHAFGAFKKFGHQSTDTPEGHSADFTSTFNIHRNYSWVFCSGKGARTSFAEAFSCPDERVIPMDRPEYDELVRKAAKRREDAREHPREQLAVLMAPTLRINDESAHPFRTLHEKHAEFERAIADGCGATVTWSFHPLESGLPAPGNVSDQLLNCDCLVTDYSSIVYEAYLLEIPVFFYVPDLGSYRVSPGLNADPGISAPSLCASTREELIELITTFAEDRGGYPWNEFEEFAGSAFVIDQPRDKSAAARIVDFAIEHAR